MTAASASQHSFVGSRALPVTVAAVKCKNGLGSIAAGYLSEDVLDYLQKDPTLQELHAERRRNNFEPNPSTSREEGELTRTIHPNARVSTATLIYTRSLRSDYNIS